MFLSQTSLRSSVTPAVMRSRPVQAPIAAQQWMMNTLQMKRSRREHRAFEAKNHSPSKSLSSPSTSIVKSSFFVIWTPGTSGSESAVQCARSDCGHAASFK